MSRANTPVTGRRDFFRALVVAGGSAAVLAAGGRVLAQPAVDGGQPGVSGGGYRLSGHVKAYYESLRI